MMDFCHLDSKLCRRMNSVTFLLCRLSSRDHLVWHLMLYGSNQRRTLQRTLKQLKELRIFSWAGKEQFIFHLVHSPETLYSTFHYLKGFFCCNCRFIDPLMYGDYPKSLKDGVGSRLPNFTRDESALLKGSLDFVGINHYTTFYAEYDANNLTGMLLNDSLADSRAITLRKFWSWLSYFVILITAN